MQSGGGKVVEVHKLEPPGGALNVDALQMLPQVGEEKRKELVLPIVVRTAQKLEELTEAPSGEKD